MSAITDAPPNHTGPPARSGHRRDRLRRLPALALIVVVAGAGWFLAIRETEPTAGPLGSRDASSLGLPQGTGRPGGVHLGGGAQPKRRAGRHRANLDHQTARRAHRHRHADQRPGAHRERHRGLPLAVAGLHGSAPRSRATGSCPPAPKPGTAASSSFSPCAPISRAATASRPCKWTTESGTPVIERRSATDWRCAPVHEASQSGTARLRPAFKVTHTRGASSSPRYSRRRRSPRAAGQVPSAHLRGGEAHGAAAAGPRGPRRAGMAAARGARLSAERRR